jgi:hypothetical protein
MSINNINIKFVQGDEAKNIMLNSDNYFNIMNNFDRAIRMESDRNDITQDEFGNYATEHILDWLDEEKEIVNNTINEISQFLTTYKFKGVFPNPVKIIKTDGLEDIRECTGYCRKNTIVVKISGIKKIRTSFWIHELFHIFSQNNPELRDQLYNSIGFFRCNELTLPSDIKEKTLTNPDCPNHDVYIKVTSIYDNIEICVTPVLFYDRTTIGGFFQKLYIKLIQVEKQENGDYIVKLENNKVKDFDVIDVINFFDQIGHCHYYFHPDEILATRFEKLYINDHDKYIDTMIDILFDNLNMVNATKVNNFWNDKGWEEEVKEEKVDEEKVDEEKVDEKKVDEEKVDEEKVDEEKVDEEKVDEVKVDEVKVDEIKIE